jgi:hypothetical protein
MLPNASIKMDVGHVLFGRLGKRFDKAHAMYGKCHGLSCCGPTIATSTPICPGTCLPVQ